MDSTFSSADSITPVACIDFVADVTTRGLTFSETLQRVADALPKAMLHPSKATAEVSYAGMSFRSPGHAPSPATIEADFASIDDHKGRVLIAYHASPDSFTPEETRMINVVGRLVCGFVNAVRGRDLYASRPREK